MQKLHYLFKYLSIYALLMTCPYIVNVKSFIARHEQQFSILHDLPSLNYPEFISVGKCGILWFAIEVASETYGNPSKIEKFPDGPHRPTCMRVYWDFNIIIRNKNVWNNSVLYLLTSLLF